jgi:hypothetical protein
MIPAADIAALVMSLGGDQFEQYALTAIAWAESRFDEKAVGDNGWSHGLFQAERSPGVPINLQVNTALNRIREQEKYFGSQLRSLSEYIDCSNEMLVRFHKAAWQTHPKMPCNWLSYINNNIFDIIQQHEKLGFQITTDEILEALVGEKRKLNVYDMISWAGKRNANAQALFSGQEQISEYLSKNKIQGPITAGNNIRSFLIVSGVMALFFILFKR